MQRALVALVAAAFAACASDVTAPTTPPSVLTGADRFAILLYSDTTPGQRVAATLRSLSSEVCLSELTGSAPLATAFVPTFITFCGSKVYGSPTVGEISASSDGSRLAYTLEGSMP